jgi:hypothetical protein
VGEKLKAALGPLPWALAHGGAAACWMLALVLLLYAWLGVQDPGSRLAAVTAGGTLALAGSALLAWQESRALVSETRNLVNATVVQAQAAQIQATMAGVQADEARRQRELADHAMQLSVAPNVTFILAVRQEEAPMSTLARIDLKNDGPGVAYHVRVAVHAFRGDPPEHRFWSSDTALPQLGPGLVSTSYGDASQPGDQRYRVLTDLVELDGNGMAYAVGFDDALCTRYRLVAGQPVPQRWRPGSGDPQPEWAQRWPD